MSQLLSVHNPSDTAPKITKKSQQVCCFSVQNFLPKLLLAIVLTALYDNWHIRPPHNLVESDVSLTKLNLRNETPAQILAHEVRVLCWVMTTPKYHKARAIHVKRTWGKRCNRLLFVTSQPDDELDTLVVSSVNDTYQNLWGKARAAFRYIWQHHRDEADWFLKADDDSYVFVENLRYLLYPYSPNMPIHFGHPFKLPQKKDTPFMSGGSGYVLSKEALRRFVEISMDDPSKCIVNYPGYHEDLEIAVCMDAVGVVAGDSRDSKLRLRFVPFEPYTMLRSNYWTSDFWFFDYAFYRVHSHRDTISDAAVAFHYIAPQDMYVFDFMNYEFNAFGIDKALAGLLPKKLKPEEVVIPPSDNL